MPKPDSGWHRRNPNSQAALARAREYRSPAHKAARIAGQRQVDNGTAHCWRCGKHLPPGSTWHVGHDDNDRRIIRGTECPPCNLRAAARKGNKIANAQRQVTRQRRAQSRAW